MAMDVITYIPTSSILKGVGGKIVGVTVLFLHLHNRK